MYLSNPIGHNDRLSRASVFLALMLLSSCSQKENNHAGFSLPPGDAAAGRKVFVELQCNTCHSAPDVKQIETGGEQPITIALGGEVRHLKTYGELVTSVVNPSHKIYQGFSDRHQTSDGESKMRNYNDVMTVSQLFDLISFLETQYHLKPYEKSQYRAPYIY